MLLVCSLLRCIPLFSSAPQADCHRLNGPLPLGADGAVLDFAFAPDERRVVYRVLESSGSPVELFSATADGFAPVQVGPRPDPKPVRLSGRMTAGGNVVSFQIRGRWVVYLADARTDEQFELFAVPIDGSAAPLRLDVGLVDEGDVRAFAIAPDATRVVFTADALVDERVLLFSVPVTGGAAIVLNEPLAAGGDVHEFAIDPGSSSVVYRGNHVSPSESELFSASIDVPLSAVRLDDPLSGGDVNAAFAFSPDGSRVVFSDGHALYSAPPDGSALPTLLASYHSGPFEITGDGRTVVFRAVYVTAVPIEGGAPVILSTSGGFYFRVSPDSQRVVFWDRDELHSARIDGRGGPVLLHAPQPGDLYEVEITPDGAHVLFSEFASGFTLHVSPIDGSSPAWLLDSLAALCGSPQFVASGDGSRVVYRKRPSPDASLWSTRVDGSATPIALASEDLICVPYQVSSSTDRVAWIGSNRQLFTRPIDGRTVPLQIHRDFPRATPMGDVGGYAVAADRVVYAADQEIDDRWALYSVGLPGGGSPVRLGELYPTAALDAELLIGSHGSRAVFRSWSGSGTLASVAVDGSEPVATPLSDFRIRSFQLGPDDEHVFFTSNTAPALFRAPVDGSAPAVSLSGPTASGLQVEEDYRVAPDGLGAIFRGDLDTDGVVELYRGDGLVRTRLASMPLSGDVHAGFVLSQNGTRVLYVADQLTDERFELFSVPATGGALVVLSGPMIAAGDVRQCLVTPDGERALFVANAEVLNRSFLYATAADGSGFPARLCVRDDGDVRPDVQLDPSGTRAVYRQGPSLQLRSVPVDGSRLPALLSPPSSSGVTTFRITADGTRVVFVVRQQLYSAPLDGRAPPVRLSLEEQDVEHDTFASSPDGTRVAFFVDGDLFVVPIDGSEAPQPVACDAAPFVFSDFRWTQDSSAVLYRSRPDHAIELFARTVEPPASRVANRVRPRAR